MEIKVGDWVVLAPQDGSYCELQQAMKTRYGYPNGFTTTGIKVVEIKGDTAKLQIFNEIPYVNLPRPEVNYTFEMPLDLLESKMPVDMNGTELNVGDTVVFPVGKGQRLVQGTVLKFLGVKHHGCGWWEVGIEMGSGDGTKYKNYYPDSRLVVKSP